jgi:hypothetical protein
VTHLIQLESNVWRENLVDTKFPNAVDAIEECLMRRGPRRLAFVVRRVLSVLGLVRLCSRSGARLILLEALDQTSEAGVARGRHHDTIRQPLKDLQAGGAHCILGGGPVDL